ncbi:Omp28-related outer membrane protein [Kaistella sp.]|uniref:Omp28-related outer membrane protein n=1 Tax=Kaistella sp. TaxID=2782235 RepID=UPI003C6800F8
MKKLFLLLILFVFFLNSCAGSESDEGRDAVTYVKLSASENSVLLGNSVNFSLTDNLNNDVTNNATFYVDGVEINKNTYAPAKIGEYHVVAKYNTFTSKPLTLNAIALTGVNFVHRILYEDFTGTWCGNCPIASVRYEELIKKNNKVVFVGLHGPTVATDPFTNAASYDIITKLGIWAYPTILINHTQNWNTANNDFADMTFPLGFIKASSKMGIAITTKLEGNTLSGEYNISFADNYNNLKTIVYIVEDKIVYPQHNYFNGSGGKPILYGGVPIIENYSNHNVLRDLLTSSTGDAIPSGSTQNNTAYFKNFSYAIPANFNKENMKIVVAVLNAQNEVLNVREASPNTSNALETL